MASATDPVGRQLTASVVSPNHLNGWGELSGVLNPAERVWAHRRLDDAVEVRAFLFIVRRSSSPLWSLPSLFSAAKLFALQLLVLASTVPVTCLKVRL